MMRVAIVFAAACRLGNGLGWAEKAAGAMDASEEVVERTGDGYTTRGFGVDTSFPMHNYMDKKSWGGKMYEEFIQGCGDTFKMRSCVSNEESRMAMNRDQIPRQRNFTELGFAKIKAPSSVYGPARAFWDLHKRSTTSESWPAGNTYVNHWRVDSQMVSLEDRRFQPLGLRTKDKIWAGAKPILEAWTGQKLKPTSLYGIRKYEAGAVLATHVDRLPLVTSAIIQVDQDVDAPWPIEVVGHDGVAYNVTLGPGEMALYESHTVLHGRPYPLQGRFFANVFVHFIPVDPDDASKNHPDIDFKWTATASREKRDPAALARGEAARREFPKPKPHAESLADARAAAEAHDAVHAPSHGAVQDHPPPAEFGAALGRPGGGGRAAKTANLMPPRDDGAGAAGGEAGHQIHDGEDFGADAFLTGTQQSIHEAAAKGDVDLLALELERRPDAVNEPDENLWTPLHEAARGGDLKTVEFLVEHGANLGDTTLAGGSALWIAKQNHNNKVVAFFAALGAPDVADQDL